MQLSLRNATIPDSHVVSFRTGETRRQAPVEKLLRTPVTFPIDPERTAEPIEIEIMKVVASTQLVLQKGLADYSIPLGGVETAEGTVAGLDVSVRPQEASDDKDAGRLEDKASDEDGCQHLAMAAKRYLEDKGVTRYLHAMLQDIIRERPLDPYVFMQRRLHQDRGELWTYQPANGLHVAIRETPDVDGRKTSYEMCPGDQFNVIETQKGADNILYLRLADGRGWLFDSKPGVGEMCKKVPVLRADDASCSGDLAQGKEGLPAKIVDTGNWDNSSKSPKSNPQVHSELSEGLHQACHNSNLQTASDEIMADPGGPGNSSGDNSSRPPKSKPQNRSVLRQGLQQACLDGNLLRAFNEVMGMPPASTEEPTEAGPAPQAPHRAEGGTRHRMRAAFDKACSGGVDKPTAVLGAPDGERKPEEVKTRLKRHLQGAFRKGNLREAFQVHETDTVRERVRSKLEESLGNGDLDAAFQEAMRPAQLPPIAGVAGRPCPLPPLADAPCPIQEALTPAEPSPLPPAPPAAQQPVAGSEGARDPQPAAAPQIALGPGPVAGAGPAEATGPQEAAGGSWLRSEDLQLVQSAIQGLREDNVGMRKHIEQMNQKMESLRRENEALMGGRQDDPPMLE